MAQAILFSGGMTQGVDPVRITDGVLAVGAAVASSTTASRRVNVGGLSKITVRVKCATVVGVPTIQIKGLLNDAFAEDATGTQAATLNAAAVNIVDATEASIVFNSNGEQYADIIVTCGGGASIGSITYIDIFATPLYG